MAQSKQQKKSVPPVLPPPVDPPVVVLAERSFLHHPVWPALVLAAVALLVWGGSVYHEFVFFDDDKAILYNAALRQPSLGKFFSGQNLGMYAPLTWMAYWLGSAFSGQNAWGYHLLGVVLHALNSVLMFTLLHNLTGRRWLAFAVGLLFAVH
ncbi:MAG: hypothetical protein ABIO24_06990, partial [Saprospiraceae bacterium]